MDQKNISKFDRVNIFTLCIFFARTMFYITLDLPHKDWNLLEHKVNKTNHQALSCQFSVLFLKI